MVKQQQERQQQEDSKHFSSVFELISRKHLFFYMYFAICLYALLFPFIENPMICILEAEVMIGPLVNWWNVPKVQKELGIYRQALRACEMATCLGKGQ